MRRRTRLADALATRRRERLVLRVPRELRLVIVVRLAGGGAWNDRSTRHVGAHRAVRVEAEAHHV